MKATKYLLAKYIPDLHRFEPRNIGVIVWSPMGVEARFLAEYPDRPGEVDGRSNPGFLTSANAYNQWIRYWRDAITSGIIQPPGGAALVPASSPQFMAVLQQTGRGNFVITEAGAVLGAVKEGELSTLADQLFTELVEAAPPEEATDLGFDELCDALMQRTNLKPHRYFQDPYPVRCTIRGVEEDFILSHAVANGTVERAYQRFPFPKRKALLQKNRDATAWMFDNLQVNRLVTPEKTILLINATADQLDQLEVVKTLQLLGSMARIVNLGHETEALAEFAAAARLPVY